MVGDLDLRSPSARFLAAALYLALAVFLGALGFGIVTAPMNGNSPLVGWLLKAFIAFMFGGISLAALVGAVRSLSGANAKARGVPAEVLSRCLTCGETSPNNEVCPFCGEPPGDRAAHIRVEHPGFIGGWAVGAAISTGITCLGFMVLVGPYLDGERRIWALIAFAALALLMLGVGIAGVIGCFLSLRDNLRGGSRITFHVRSPDRYTNGDGTASWGKVVSLNGNGIVTTPLAPKPRPEGGYRVSPGDLWFAETIATLDAAGVVQIHNDTTYKWSLEKKPSSGRRSEPLEFKRNVTSGAIVQLTPLTHDVDPDDADHPLVEMSVEESSPNDPDTMFVWRRRRDLYFLVHRFFMRFLMEPVSLAQLKQKLDEAHAHRAQAEAHARALREAGVIVSQELVDAILSRLDAR